jgi:hypothetical protein
LSRQIGQREAGEQRRKGAVAVMLLGMPAVVGFAAGVLHQRMRLWLRRRARLDCEDPAVRSRHPPGRNQRAQE